MQSIDVGRTAISHSRAYSSDKLVDDVSDTAFVRNAGDDALWNELLRAVLAVLEIAVA